LREGEGFQGFRRQAGEKRDCEHNDDQRGFQFRETA
jgi:hypothetical protein